MVQVLGLVIWGLIIGAVARLIKKGEQDLSLLMTLVLGVVSAVVGGYLADLVGWGNITELNVGGFVIAVVVGVLVIGLAERFGRA